MTAQYNSWFAGIKLGDPILQTRSQSAGVKFSDPILQTTGRGEKSTSLWAHWNLFWQLSRGSKLEWFRYVTCHDSLSKASLQGTLTGGQHQLSDQVRSRGNAGCTTSKSGHSYPCKNCSQWPAAEKTGAGYLLNRPSCPPYDQAVNKELSCFQSRALRSEMFSTRALVKIRSNRAGKSPQISRAINCSNTHFVVYLWIWSLITCFEERMNRKAK